MKLNRRQLRALINEAFRGNASPPIPEPDELVTRVANALANRAAHMNILDDIHDSGGDASELFYDFPRELVMRLSDGDDGEGLLAAIARGDYDPSLEELAYPSEPGDISESYGDFAMSSQDQLQSGMLEDKLLDDMSSLVSNAMAMGVDTKMIARALENALGMAHMAVRGSEMDYEVEITPVRVPPRYSRE